MLDPSMTNVLPKRVLASLLDLGIVAAISAIVARLSAEQFTHGGLDSSGAPQWTAPQFARLSEIQEGGLNRKVVLSDTFYVWSGTRLWIPIAVALALLGVVFVLLPMFLGRTPGHGVMGLQVRRLDGDEPTARDHVMRALGGVIDVLPVIVPGLLGWAIASTSPHRRRVGDRLAGTAVVDSTIPIRFVETEVPSPNVGPARVTEPAGGATERASSARPDPAPQTVPDPDPELARDPQPDPAQDPDPVPESEPDLVDLSSRLADPPESSPAPAADPPVEAVTPAWLAVEPAASGPVAPERPDIFRNSAIGSARQARTERADWESPTATPAPVWTPPPPEHRAATSRRVNITLEDLPDPAAQRADVAPDTAKLDHSATDHSATEHSATEHSATEHSESEQTDPEPGLDPSPAVVAPADAPGSNALQWSDQWNSWLYFDPATNAWMRHDTEANQWVVLEG